MTQPDESSSSAEQNDTPKTSSKRRLPPAPGTRSGVNLAVAEIILRGVADRMRGKVDTDIATRDNEKRKTGERDEVDGRSLITSVGLYGAAKLAKRSRAGLGFVAGGLLAKSLYDRGKAVRERRLKREDKTR